MKEREARFVGAAVADAPIITALRQRVWASTYRGIFPDGMIDDFDHAWHGERDRQRIESSEYRVWLITVAGEAAGYLIVRRGEPVLLQSLYLLPEQQGQGLGRAAFALVRECCREEGAERFICHCHPDNAPAMAFYAAMGGVVIRREEGDEERWKHAVVFSFPV